MSLHLIESTKMPAPSTRRRSGVMMSVILHAALVVGAFTAASAAPTIIEPRVVTDLVYTAPTPVKNPEHSNSATNASAHTTNARTQIALPAMPDLSTIPIEIPAITPETNNMMYAFSERVFDRRSSGSGNGNSLGVESGNGTSVGTGIMSDLQVDRQVSILSGYRTPRYPEMLRAAGVEETLKATFVVDTLGRVEAGSLEVANAQHAPFVAAVREALANARFHPAEVHGQPVRQRVVQAFVFSLQKN